MKIKKQILLDNEFSIYSFDESTYDEVILFLEELLERLKSKNLGYEKFIFVGSKLYGVRDETDEEYNSRMEIYNKHDMIEMERKRKRYYELKQKYEKADN